MSNKLIARFNNPDTLGVISSFPVKGGEIARANAISRYTFLLTNSFPKNQKVVVFSEKRKSVKPYLLSRNILVAPSYKVNSPGFLVSLLSQILRFNRLPNFLIQFEFSVFGGKIVIPQILMLLFALKLLGKSTKIMFHQVVADINTLYGHLAIKKDGLKAGLLNVLLRTFYSTVGIFSEKIFVHDGVLAARIANFVDGRKIRIIPHGITRERKFSKGFEAASKAHFGIRRDTKLIGLFGYCSWYKGTDWLIENFARFAGGNPG